MTYQPPRFTIKTEQGIATLTLTYYQKVADFAIQQEIPKAIQKFISEDENLKTHIRAKAKELIDQKLNDFLVEAIAGLLSRRVEKQP